VKGTLKEGEPARLRCMLTVVVEKPNPATSCRKGRDKDELSVLRGKKIQGEKRGEAEESGLKFSRGGGSVSIYCVIVCSTIS